MAKEIKVFNLSGEFVSSYAISDKLLVQKINDQAIFDSVIAENSAFRQGTHSTLTKGEVSGGGRKPYKQKHTGRARQGSIRNPHYRHGGVVFGPKPNRNYKIKINRKVYELAFKSALSYKLNENLFYGVVDELNMDKPSTKLISNMLKKINGNCIGKQILFITFLMNDSVKKSVNNIEKIVYKTWNQVSPQDILKANTIFIQPSVFVKWEEVY